MTVAVFVDTNVLVYARDASEPSKQARAAEWLRELWLEQRGRTSVQVLSEYYTTVTRKLRPGIEPDDAWDDVNALFAWQPQKIDRHLLEKAREVERRHALSLVGLDDRSGRAATELRGAVIRGSPTRLDLRHGQGAQPVRRPNRGGSAGLRRRVRTTLTASTARQTEETSLVGRLSHALEFASLTARDSSRIRDATGAAAGGFGISVEACERRYSQGHQSLRAAGA